MPPKYRLKNVLTGETYSLLQASSVIGRNHHCEIKIDSVALSRNHASLHLTDNGVIVEDLNSTNGTFVNNVQITQPTLLCDGDVITIGNHRLILIEPTQGRQKENSSNDLMEELAQFQFDDRTASKTMVRSSFALSMGELEEVIEISEGGQQGVEELILDALHSSKFDPARVPAVLVVKNSRSRGMLIQLKLPIGGDSDWAIGRSQLADVVLDDPTVSNVHAVISAREEKWFISDNDSTNGIKVNHVIVSESECRHGDTIAIGSIEMIFCLLHQ